MFSISLSYIFIGFCQILQPIVAPPVKEFAHLLVVDSSNCGIWDHLKRQHESRSETQSTKSNQVHRQSHLTCTHMLDIHSVQNIHYITTYTLTSWNTVGIQGLCRRSHVTFSSVPLVSRRQSSSQLLRQPPSLPHRCR